MRKCEYDISCLCDKLTYPTCILPENLTQTGSPDSHPVAHTHSSLYHDGINVHPTGSSSASPCPPARRPRKVISIMLTTQNRKLSTRRTRKMCHLSRSLGQSRSVIYNQCLGSIILICFTGRLMGMGLGNCNISHTTHDQKKKIYCSR